MLFTQYLTTCFIEEATEVAHAASKVQRFTPFDSYEPGGPSNLETLTKEFSELIAVKEMLSARGISIGIDERVVADKKTRLLEYASYSKMLGVITDDVPRT